MTSNQDTSISLQDQILNLLLEKLLASPEFKDLHSKDSLHIGSLNDLSNQATINYILTGIKGTENENR